MGLLTKNRKSFDEVEEEDDSFNYEEDKGVKSNSDFVDEEVYDDTYDSYDTSVSQDAEFAKVLIETDTYINRMQLTLENKFMRKTRIQKEGGDMEITQIPTQIPNTKPLLNNDGVSQVIGRVKGVIHHVTMLGNIDKEQYGSFISRFIKDFVRTIVIHRKTWDIKEDSMRDIRRIVVDGVGLAITRPIGDRERSGLHRRPDMMREDNMEKKGFLSENIKKFRNRRGYD